MSRPFAIRSAWALLAAQLRRPFVRQAGILQLGGAVALAMSYPISILLARWLGPDGYGAYALVVSTATTISLFKRLGQDYVATTSLATAYATRNPKAATDALVAFNAVNVWSTILVIPAALVLAPAITEWWFADGSLADPLRLALLPPLWAMVLATVVIVLQCSRRLFALTVLENGNSLAIAVCGIVLVWTGMGVNGVFLGQAAASLVLALIAAAVYGWLRSHDPLVPSWRKLAVGSLWPGGMVVPEFRSGLAAALDKNLISLYTLAPLMLLGSRAPTEHVALLRVALSYLAVPMVALSAVSRLLMVKLPEIYATQPARVQSFFLRVTLLGGLASCLLTLPFVLLAPWMIRLLYGDQFAASAQIVPLLALQPLFAGFGIAAGPVYRTYRRNLLAFITNLSILVVGIPLAYILVNRYGLEGAALAYSVLATLLLAASYLLCWRIVRQPAPVETEAAQGPGSRGA